MLPLKWERIQWNMMTAHTLIEVDHRASATLNMILELHCLGIAVEYIF